MKIHRHDPARKISPTFSARLNEMGSRERVRAIVLLGTPDIAGEKAARQTRRQRREAVKAVQESAERALSELDEVLARYGGSRLSERPDALGAMPVETTPAGVRALARSRQVRAIMEDQEARLI
ncbi:MAG: hypothetical protein GX620_09270 [Chloroflexi bacterium]|nr:hypothetical protein [Chloroflexota bacterium]